MKHLCKLYIVYFLTGSLNFKPGLNSPIKKNINETQIWNKYIETFVGRTWKELCSSIPLLAWYWSHFRHSVCQFNRLARRCLSISVLRNITNCYVLFPPTGKLMIQELNWDRRYNILSKRNHKVPSVKQLHWIFKLHRGFRLNLTFPLLSILTKHHEHCVLGKLFIVDISKNSTTDTYCGFYSNLAHFPSFPWIGIQIHISFVASCDIHMLFDTINSTFAVSHKNHLMKNAPLCCAPPVWGVLFSGTRKTKFLYKIQVSKVCYISLFFCDDQHLHDADCHPVNVDLDLHDADLDLHDGPGAKSPKIKFSTSPDGLSQVVTSTFQCAIFVRQNSQDTRSLSLQYKAIPQSPSMRRSIFLQNPTLILFPNEFVQSILVLSCNVLAGQHVNVTIVTMHHNSNRNQLCNFAGVSVLSTTHNTTKEDSSQCQNQENNYMFMSTYSSSENVSVVLFYYKYYAEFNVSLKLSVTNCKITQENIFMQRDPFRNISLGQDICQVTQVAFEFTESLVDLVRFQKIIYFKLHKIPPPSRHGSWTMVATFRGVQYGGY